MTRARELLGQIRQAALRASDFDTTDQELIGRFVGAGDPLALELLIWRHQRMVMGVCLRLLKDVHDAEDAFQATFLVLARKARSIRNPQAVAAWLYEVAYRVALTALAQRRQQAVRCTPLSGEVIASLASDQAPTPEHVEVLKLLDQAVSRLPEKQRGPVVLCYLEGRTHEEVGRLLGCAPGTIASRLSRARDKLRSWLERRGVTLPVAAVTAALGAQAAHGGSARELVATTVRAVQVLGRGGKILNEVSPAAVILSEGVLHAMTWARLKQALLVVALAVWCALGLGGILNGEPGPSGAPTPVAAAGQVPEKKSKAPSREQVQELVKQLGSTRYAERQAAQKALLELGPGIVPWLDEFKTGKDLETQQRLAKIRYQLAGFAEDILKFLASQPAVYQDARLEVPDHIHGLVARYQPGSGDLLLSVITNQQHKLNWPAVNLFAQTLPCHSAAQVEAILQSQLLLRTACLPRYPARINAGIEMGYFFRYDSGSWGWPRDADWQTRTTHYLDGQPYGQPYVRTYPGGSTTGWIWTGPLAEGKHVCHFVVEYSFSHQGKVLQGKVRSQDQTFEVIAADTPDELIAPDSLLTTALVGQAFHLVEHEPVRPPGKQFFDDMVAPDPWAPQITWKTPAGLAMGLHVPVWGVDQPLPVDLCFDVEFCDLATGQKYRGDPLVLLKGKERHLGYLNMKDVRAFCKGRTGFVNVRVTLTPSRALALTVPGITHYYPGTISRELRVKIISP
jgi:RNA polymerase sigma factor (sigma-70 family)